MTKGQTTGRPTRTETIESGPQGAGQPCRRLIQSWAEYQLLRGSYTSRHWWEEQRMLSLQAVGMWLGNLDAPKNEGWICLIKPCNFGGLGWLIRACIMAVLLGDENPLVKSRPETNITRHSAGDPCPGQACFSFSGWTSLGVIAFR